MKRALFVLAAFVIVPLIVGLVVINTPQATRLVVSRALPLLNQRLNGSVSVGSVSGSLLNRLELTDVTLRDSTGLPLLTAERAEVRYSITGFLRRKIRLGPVRLVNPSIRLVQRAPGEPYPLMQIFKTKEGARSVLDVVITDITIERGTVIATVVKNLPALAEGSERRARLDTVRVDRLNAEIPSVRVLAVPGEPRATDVAVARANASIRYPDELVLREFAGSVSMRDDSITAKIGTLELPETKLSADGWLVMGAEEPPGYQAAIDIAYLNTSDLIGIMPRLPRSIVIRGEVAARANPAGGTDADFSDLEVTGAGGSARGTGGVTFDPLQHRLVTRDLRLRLANIDVSRVSEAFGVRSVISGRLSGSLSADGSPEDMTVRTDLRLRQPGVDPPAESRLEGSGRLALKPGARGSNDFQIRRATLDLRAARAMAPTLPLVGRLNLSGSLRGPSDNLTFAGRIHYAEDTLPPSSASGTVRIRQGTPLGIATELTFDSLNFASFQRSFPRRELHGSAAGRVTTAGTLDSLRFDASLAGEAGTVTAAGLLRARPGDLAVDALTGEVARLNFAALSRDLPGSNVTARFSGSVAIRDDTVQAGEFRITVDSSTVGRAILDTASAGGTIQDGLIRFDSLLVRASGLTVDGGGTLGLPGRSGELKLTVRADSLGKLQPFLALSPRPIDSTLIPQQGSATIDATIRGAVRDYQAEFRLEGEEIATARASVGKVSIRGTWALPGQRGSIAGSLDSVRTGRLGIARLEGEFRGALDSAAWEGHLVLDEQTELTGAGRLAGRPAATISVVFDSLAARRGTVTWRLDPRARATWGNESWSFSNTVLRQVGGNGVVAIEGHMTAADSGQVVASVKALSLADLALLADQDRPVAGVLEGEFRLSGTVRNPSGRGRFTLTSAALGDVRLPDVAMDATFADRLMRGRMGFTRDGRQALTVEGQIPIHAGDEGREALRLTIRADSLELAWFDPVLPTVSDLSGWFDAAIVATGSLRQPALEGWAELKGASVTYVELGVRHDAIDGRATFAGDRMRIERLRMMARGDSAVVAGSVEFRELYNPVLALTLDAWRFPVMDNPDLLTGRATGHVAINGPLIGATLTGRAVMTSGVAYPEDFIQKKVIDLSDPLYSQFVDTTVLRREKLAAGPLAALIDSLKIDSLEADLGPNFWIRSHDADIQLDGSLRVSKRADQYFLTGTVRTLRGTYTLRLGAGASREFVIDGGSIRYFGTADYNAELDLAAHHNLRAAQGDQVTVFVQIGGTIKRPEIRLNSNVRPPLAETEIISYLVFGAPSMQAFVGDRTGSDRGLFEQSADRFVNALSGQLESGLFERMGLPVDVFKIEPGEVQSGLSGTELLIGKQVSILGHPSFLTASPRLCPRQRLVSLENLGITLETRLSKQWGLSGSLDPTRGCEASIASTGAPFQFGFDVFWERR